MTQQVVITKDDLAHAQSLLENGQLSEMYDYLASKGDRYSTLAKGVVEGNTVSGKAALEFMEHTALQQGKTWGEVDNQDIRVNMATHYLEALDFALNNAEGGVLQRELDSKEIEAFHDFVFEQSGLGVNAWTLKTPFKMLGEVEAQKYWEDVLDSAGHFDQEVYLAVSTVARLAGMHESLAAMSSMATNQEDIDSAQAEISDWFGNYANVDAISDIGVVFGSSLGNAIDDSLWTVYGLVEDGASDAFQYLFDQDELKEVILENGTNADTYDHEFDVDTTFSHGNTEQQTSTTEEVAADVQSGNVYNTGNASVNSSTANDGGLWSVVNASITEGYQLRW